MKLPEIKVLLIEATPKYARAMREMLQGARRRAFKLDRADSVRSAIRLLNEQRFDVVLLDLVPEEGHGLDEFIQLHQAVAHLPIIVLSSLTDEELALRAVHEGAQDYLVKGEIDSQLLVRSIRYSIERKKSEAALHQAEEKYRGIYENIVEGIFQTTADGHYITANPALARIYGYNTSEELMDALTDIGRDLYVDPTRRQEFVELMEKHDVVTNFESRIYRRDKSIIWISENVRAVRDRRGHLLHYEGTVEDITERKNSEELVRNSEALYHSLVETLPQNIFRKDLNEQFTFANQRFCQTLGKPLAEIVGKTDFDFFPPELARKYQKDDQIIMETGKIFETVEENHPPGGDKIYVNVVKTPLYDADGRIIGLQGIFWDITAKRRAEEAVKKANLELALSQQELRMRNEQMEEDLRMAREIQQAIIPQQYPSFPQSATPEESAFRFCHRYLPTGAVGGDFFNIRPLSDTRAGIFICDVMGHGVRSALVTAILRALVEELTPDATDPGKLLGQINRDLRAILKQSGTPLFTTAFYMIADLEAKCAYFANAGHPRPLVLHKSNGSAEFLAACAARSNPALGLFDHSEYQTAVTPLLPDDRFVFFTDGVYDVEKEGELLSPEWLESELLKRSNLPLSATFDEIIAMLKDYSGQEFPDDMCLVGMEVAHL